VSVTREWPDWGLWVFNLLLVIVGGFQIWLLFRTFGAIKRQADNMDRQTGILEKSAKAASDNASAAEANTRTLRNLERPWVLVRMEPVEMAISDLELLDHPAQQMSLKYTIRNYGRSPAWVTKHWSGVKILPLPSDISENPLYLPIERSVDIELSEFYEPGKRRGNTIPIPYSLIFKLIKRSAFLYIYGCIVYRDVWGDSHETHFSFFYHVPPDGDLNPQDFYAEPTAWNYET
jgi:hypothetical protein